MDFPARPTRAHHRITHHEVAQALADSSNTSALGAFGSNYRLLKWVFEMHPELILDLYNVCLDLGFHSECLCNAVVAILPKPRKVDMSNPRSYRPISLLECLSKCLREGDHLTHTFRGREVRSCPLPSVWR